MSPAEPTVFLCVQEPLEPIADKGFAEYSERFQLIFLLPLISQEYFSLVTLWNIAHALDAFVICRR
jgi:hypothetical protein